MGFLLGGLLSGSADGIAGAQDKKQKAIDEEREFKVHGLQSTGAAIQSKLGQLSPDDPNRKVLMDQLSKINSDTTDLFHPSKDPGAMAHLGRLISQHVLGHKQPDQTPPVTPGQTIPSENLGMSVNLPQGHTPAVQGPPPGPQTPEALKAIAAQRMADYQAAAAVPASGTLPQAEQQEASRIKEGIDPKAAPTKPTKPVFKQYTDKDGNTNWYDVNDKESIPEGATAAATGGGVHPSQSSEAVYIRARYGEHPTADQISQGMQEHYKILHPESLTSHEQIAYDQNGNAYIAKLQGSSQKVYPPTGKPPATKTTPQTAPGGPATPGGLKAKAKAQQAAAVAQGAGAGASSRIKPLAGIHKNTATQTKANTTYNEAQRISSLADNVAAHPDNPQQQKELAISLIKNMEGRFNVASYDEIVKRAGLGNSLEAWANSLDKGALPGDVIKNLIQVAKDNETDSRKARDQSYNPDNPNAGGGNPVDDFLKNFPSK